MAIYSPHFERLLRLADAEILRAMPAPGGPEDTAARAMAYACAGGGKRLRPVLLLEFARLGGGDVQAALPFAAAVEMVHCYSLVHDDLPCMDNSPLRRGKPSVFAAFGEDIALLAGDGLLTRAFEWMLREGRDVPAERVVRAARILADAAGIDGMVGGQTMDVESGGKSPDLAALQTLQRRKTAALIAAACEMGAVLGGADPVLCEAAVRYGTEMGLCFQIVDDLLDVTASADALGKPVRADSHNGKATYVSLLGEEAAGELADERCRNALAALDAFGAEAAELAALTRALRVRDR